MLKPICDSKYFQVSALFDIISVLSPLGTERQKIDEGDSRAPKHQIRIGRVIMLKGNLRLTKTL